MATSLRRNFSVFALNDPGTLILNRHDNARPPTTERNDHAEITHLQPTRLSEAAMLTSRQVWLASLGAAVVTRDWVQTEAGDMFKTLVKEGTVVESRAIRFVGDRIESSVSIANTVWKETRRTVESTVKQAATRRSVSPSRCCRDRCRSSSCRSWQRRASESEGREEGGEAPGQGGQEGEARGQGNDEARLIRLGLLRRS